MARKKTPTSDCDAGTKAATPLATRLREVITDVDGLKDYLGVSRQAVNQFMLGINRPSLENLIKIADFCDTSTDYLLGRTSVRSVDMDVQGVCRHTGLSENAVKTLHNLHNAPLRGLAWVRNNKEYSVGYCDVLSDILESPNDFNALMMEVSYVIAYGGGLPDEAYTDEESSEMSVEDMERFRRWERTHGREIMSRADARDLHLQLAGEKMKDICKRILDKRISNRGGTDNGVN